MILEHEILLNKFGQELVQEESLVQMFMDLDYVSKNEFLYDMLFIIQQSKPMDTDIEPAILRSGLKSTYTPCILLKKGVAHHNLQRIINLPEKEMTKTFLLLLSLFRESYGRRFAVEKNDPDKWWYWDLSDEKNINKIRGIG